MEVVKKKNEKAKELIEREEIKNTPFTIIKTKGKCFGVLGQHRITEEFSTKEEVKEDLREITWNRITQVLMIVIEKLKENKTI